MTITLKCGQCGKETPISQLISARGFEPVCSMECGKEWDKAYDAKFNQNTQE